MEIDSPNSSNHGECTICLSENVSLLPLVCRHSFCGTCLKKMDQCPMCRQLIELKDVFGGKTFMFKCNPCGGSFKSEKMRLCVDCATTSNVEMRFSNIEKMKSISYCLSCIFPDHIDKGHKSISLLDYDVERRQLLDNQKKCGELVKKFNDINEKTKTSTVNSGLITKVLNHVKAAQISQSESELLSNFLNKVEQETTSIQSVTNTQNEKISSIVGLIPEDVRHLFDATTSTPTPILPNITEFYRASKLGFEESKWNQLGEKEDAISFTVSEPTILHYIGVFGSKKKESFEVTLKILERKEEGFVQKATKKETIESTGRQLVHNIILNEPIHLFPNFKYHVVLLVKPLSSSNCRAFYIHSGETKITEAMNGRLVRVEIFNSSLSKNGSGDDDGQIPLLGLSLPEGERSDSPPQIAGPSSSSIIDPVGSSAGSRASSKRSSSSDTDEASEFSDMSDTEDHRRTVKRAKRSDPASTLKAKEKDCKMQ